MDVVVCLRKIGGMKGPMLWMMAFLGVLLILISGIEGSNDEEGFAKCKAECDKEKDPWMMCLSTNQKPKPEKISQCLWACHGKHHAGDSGDKAKCNYSPLTFTIHQIKIITYRQIRTYFIGITHHPFLQRLKFLACSNP